MATYGTRFSISKWIIPLVAVGLFALPTMAQNQPGGPGGFDPSQFRQRMLDRVKDALGASDEEMQALGPKIEKVFTLQMEMNMGRMGFRRNGGQGGPGGQGGQPGQAAPAAPQEGQPTSALVTATHELQTTLDNKDAKPEEIKAKLQAYRDAKAAAKAEMTKAQGELRDLLTQRQEATLVMMGMLD
jgi:hypothetical protein